MELTEYLSHVASDGPALAAAAATAPKAPVPNCPDWDMTELVRHTTAVHHWVTHIVSTREQGRPKGTFFEDPPKEWDALAAHYEAGLSALLTTLGAADPGVAVWNWFDDRPAPTAFWIRRMAQETVVHRWDAQCAAGSAGPIAPDLAEDGIDEFLTFVTQWVVDQRPRADLVGTLDLHNTDTGSRRRLSMRLNRLEVTRDAAGEPEAAVEGSASDVYLWMNNRLEGGDRAVVLSGNADLLAAWRQLAF